MRGLSLLAPRFELSKLFRIDFFPTRPETLDGRGYVCLGTKSRTIGDALMLTTLPAKLRAKYPALQIYTYPRGFNPVVFYGNPHVRGVRYVPRELYGDDLNWGHGHLIHLKEAFFDLPASSPPKPEIHLLDREIKWAQKLVRESSSPICVIHPWGNTVRSVVTRHFWETLVNRWSHSYRFWHLGISGHERVSGCERHLLLPTAYRHARKAFAALSQAQLFIGVNSGPMHIARAFNVPSIILTREGDIDTIFRTRKEAAWFLYDNWRHSFLYEENIHIDINLLREDQLIARLDDYLERHHPSDRSRISR